MYTSLLQTLEEMHIDIDKYFDIREMCEIFYLPEELIGKEKEYFIIVAIYSGHKRVVEELIRGGYCYNVDCVVSSSCVYVDELNMVEPLLGYTRDGEICPGIVTYGNLDEKVGYLFYFWEEQKRFINNVIEEMNKHKYLKNLTRLFEGKDNMYYDPVHYSNGRIGDLTSQYKRKRILIPHLRRERKIVMKISIEQRSLVGYVKKHFKDARTVFHILYYLDIIQRLEKYSFHIYIWINMPHFYIFLEIAYGWNIRKRYYVINCST